MMIDEESLQTLLDASSAKEREKRSWVGSLVHFVQVVEAWLEIYSSDSFPG